MTTKNHQHPLPSLAKKDKQNNGRKYQAHHIRAVQLRFEGLTHAEISSQLEVEYGKKIEVLTLRSWFRHGERGYLSDLYSDYARQESEQMILSAREKMKKMVPKALEKLQQLLEKRFVYNMVGDPVYSEDGTPVEKLDAVTHKAIVTILQSVGFKIEDLSAGDPIDSYFDRVEQVAERKLIAPPPSPKKDGSDTDIQ